MSTVFHEPIVAGESNAPSTVNTRFADLDAAIVELDDRVDTIIADGDSSAEVVDSRNGYTVLSKNVNDKAIKTQEFLVDPAFDGLTAAGRFKTIQAALNAATPGTLIRVAAGTYTENLTFGDDSVTLEGAGQPYFDGTDMLGGTIIEGEVDINNKLNPTVRNLGIDIRGVSGVVDGIQLGSVVSSPMQYQTFENLTLVGKGTFSVPDRGHGILCSSGGGNLINKCNIFMFYHGIALRSSFNTVSDCYLWGCTGNSIIIKSEAGSGDAVDNVVTNCKLDGDAADAYFRAGPIRLQAAALAYVTKDNTVSNISVKNSGTAAILIEAVSGGTAVLGNVGWNTISNVVCRNGGDSSIRAEFDCYITSDNTFVNCQSNSRNGGWGFRTDGCSRIRAIGCLIDSTGAGQLATGSYLMWQDFGGGGGVQVAALDGVYLLDTGTHSRLIDRSKIITGAGAANTTPETFLRITHNPGTGTSTIGVFLHLLIANGTLARTYHIQIPIVRPASSTLVATVVVTDGAPATTAGTGASATVTVDTGTANVANIQIAASSSTIGYYYTAIIVTGTASAWYAENLAA